MEKIDEIADQKKLNFGENLGENLENLGENLKSLEENFGEKVRCTTNGKEAKAVLLKVLPPKKTEMKN